MRHAMGLTRSKRARDEGPLRRTTDSDNIATGAAKKGTRAVARCEALGDVPFEFVGEIASAGAVTEARDVERGATTARHDCCG
jgi:hypothetical protein